MQSAHHISGYRCGCCFVSSCLSGSIFEMLAYCSLKFFQRLDFVPEAHPRTDIRQENVPEFYLTVSKIENKRIWQLSNLVYHLCFIYKVMSSYKELSCITLKNDTCRGLNVSTGTDDDEEIYLLKHQTFWTWKWLFRPAMKKSGKSRHSNHHARKWSPPFHREKLDKIINTPEQQLRKESDFRIFIDSSISMQIICANESRTNPSNEFNR